LGEDHFEDIKSGKVEFEDEDLIGGELRAKVEENDKGYSVLIWDSIDPVKTKTSKNVSKKAKAKKELEELEAQNAHDLETAELAKDENNALMMQGAAS
jgi:hypothetical protein